MIDKKIKALYEAKHGDLVNVLVDIIKYQDERISELEKIEKSKHEIVCTIPKFTLEHTIPIIHTFTKEDLFKNVQHYLDSNDTYDSIVITKDFIISKVTETFKEITETIMNSESMVDISFHYYNFFDKHSECNEGYRLNFGVFINQRCTTEYDNYVKLVDGKIEIKLCEAIERCGIEEEMVIRLSNLSQHLLKLGYPNLS